MEITLQEFLRRKGAIGMLSLLHERPMTYSEIEPEIEVTSDTIITRRDQAAELGLLNISLGEAENGTKKVYHLTDMGEFLTDKMAREGLISNYRKMRTLEHLVDEQTDALVNWAIENPSQLLQFEDAVDGTIRRDSNPDTDEETSGNDTGIETESIESNMGDSPVDPPQRPSERTDTNDTEMEEQPEDGSDNRPQNPSDLIPDEVKEKDISNTDQGTFSDMESAESDDEPNNED